MPTPLLPPLARLLCAMALAALGGCALQPPDQMKKADDAFDLAYQQYADSKYSAAAGENRLQYYDQLLKESDSVINTARKADQERAQELNAERRVLEQSLQASRVNLAQSAAVIKALKKRMDDKLAKQTTLSKNPEQNERKLDELQRELDQLSVELEGRASEELNQQARIRAEEQRLELLGAELAAIRTRDYGAVADQKRRAVRNEIVHERLLVADSIYLKMRKDLLMGRAGMDTVLDISELMLSTATTLTGGAMAKANLGAASTLLKGSRTSVDKNFFAQQTLAAILNAIEDRRQQDKLVIVKGLATSTSDYPLQQALADVRLYQSRASLMAGVLELSNQSAAKAKESEAAVETEKDQQAKKNAAKAAN